MLKLLQSHYLTFNPTSVIWLQTSDCILRMFEPSGEQNSSSGLLTVVLAALTLLYLLTVREFQCIRSFHLQGARSTLQLPQH